MSWVCTLLVLCNLASKAGGNPCLDSTNTCDKVTQKCEAKPNARDFTCRCIKDYKVLAADNTCVDISDRQRVYLSFPLCIPVSANLSIPIDSLREDPGSTSEEFLLAYKNFARHDFKTVQTHAFEWSYRLVYDKQCFLVYTKLSIVFENNVTDENREMVALTVLRMEKTRSLHALGHVLRFYGNISIFHSPNKDLEWCSYSRLLSCPAHSKCVNNKVTRYSCLCDSGYFKDGENCTLPVRLVSSAVTHQGLLEYYTNEVWHSVCSDKFGAPEAGVVCRQLGFDGREARVYTKEIVMRIFYADLHKNAVSIYNFRCNGKENSLMDCTKKTRSSCCSEADHVYVTCSTECPDDNHYGPNCTQTCDCLRNNTDFCSRQNGSCVCSAGWDGENCTDDVDECALGRHNCTRFNEQCENVAGSFQCACKPETMEEEGDCVGNLALSDPLPFKTNGSQNMTLNCNPPNNTSVVKWTVSCSKTSDATCTFKPQPEEDGHILFCSMLQNDLTGNTTLIGIAKIILDLQYPPPKPPEIDGYENGQVVQAGEFLPMTCTVKGGKPRVRAVNFSCPGHRDVTDVKSINYTESALWFLPVRAEDDGVMCTCSAEWEDPTFYNLTATRVLTVNGTNSRNDLPYLNTERITEALGVGTAIIACVVIIVFGIWKYLRGRTYDNLSRKNIGMYSVFAHSFHGDDVTEDYAEIVDELVDVEDSDRTDQGYSRPLSDPLPRPCTSTATISISFENELTTVAFVQEDKSDTGYFYGIYSVSATEDSGKIETISSQDSNEDKLEATSDSNIQECCSMSDSDRPSRKDYLHPTRIMLLSDEITFPECNYSQSLEVHEGEKKDYLHPTSDMSLSDEITFPESNYSQSLEVHEGEKKDYLYQTSATSLNDKLISPECSPEEHIDKKN